MATSSSKGVHAQQDLRIPFTAPRRQPSSVSVTITPGFDHHLNGQNLLNLYDDPSVTDGYPIMHATVSTPNSRTYASLYGWVQVVSESPGKWDVDLYPMFQDVKSQFAIWGANPTTVDAPSKWASVEEVDWTARTFLCYTPDAAMTKNVVPIVAFEWGFWIEEGRRLIKPLEKREVKTWNEHLGLLKGTFPEWKFEEVGA